MAAKRSSSSRKLVGVGECVSIGAGTGASIGVGGGTNCTSASSSPPSRTSRSLRSLSSLRSSPSRTSTLRLTSPALISSTYWKSWTWTRRQSWTTTWTCRSTLISDRISTIVVTLVTRNAGTHHTRRPWKRRITLTFSPTITTCETLGWERATLNFGSARDSCRWIKLKWSRGTCRIWYQRFRSRRRERFRGVWKPRPWTRRDWSRHRIRLFAKLPLFGNAEHAKWFGRPSRAFSITDASPYS